MQRYLEAGKIVGVHGLGGEVKVVSMCDSPEILCELDRLYLDNGKRFLVIERARVHKNSAIIKFEEITGIDQTADYMNRMLYLDRESLDLPEGSFFIVDLIGVRVYNADDGRLYGSIADVTQTGANDVYHVKTAEGNLLLFPAIKEVVIETDIDGKTMKVRPLRGLLDDED
ncbi:MAG: ribosome maturation factor RimM [Oscillospiraceae bacterium]|nr:ribosome maturation factor RimM [Oscillospiraceae bacterium]